MSETYLITGAAGFVGACLTRELVQRKARVHVLLKKDSDLWRLADVLGKLKIEGGDLTDARLVARMVKRIKPTVIYHLAAHGAYSTQDDAEKIITVNVLGTLNLLDACRKIDYKLFVNTGSSSEYGFKNKPMKESDLLEPNSHYALAKAAQTHLCCLESHALRKPVVTFRLFSVYGYYEDKSRLVPTIINRALRGEDLVMANPRTARDFIFIEDVVARYLAVERLRKCPGEIINIGMGRETTLKEIVGCLLRLTKSDSPVKWGQMADRIWDTRSWQADTVKEKKIFAGMPRTSLREGMRKTIEWLKAHQELYR